MRANFLASSGVPGLKALVLPFSSGYPIVESVTITSRLSRLSFTAPVTGMYTVFVGASSVGTFTVQPARIGLPYSDPPVSADIGRISGYNRLVTAVEVSKASFPGTASAVVVATGYNYADALAGSGLAGSYDCPVLLTNKSDLPSYVLNEVNRLQPEKVFVLGSSAAVSDAVFSALQGPGREVTRLAGGTRFETAVAIANQIKLHETSEGHVFTNKAFIVNGMNYPDALSASPLAFTEKMPVLLVQPTNLPAVTKDAVTNLGITQSYVIGGPSAVSDTVKDGLPGSKTRVWGVDAKGNSNRLLTSDAVAEFGVVQGWATWNTVGLTTGWNYPDALGGGVYCGKQGGVLVLTNPLFMDDPTMLTFFNHRAAISKARLFGSKDAVSGFVFGTADLILK